MMAPLKPRIGNISSVIWFIFCALVATYAAISAYNAPERFCSVVELIATVISILVGVSIAVIAVLTTPFSVSERGFSDQDEAERVSRVVKGYDHALANGQLIFFWIYFTSLALSISLKWTTSGNEVDFETFQIKALAASTAAISSFAFGWSARLPLLLKQIATQRRELG
jgi:hypothetical protein